MDLASTDNILHDHMASYGQNLTMADHNIYECHSFQDAKRCFVDKTLTGYKPYASLVFRFGEDSTQLDNHSKCPETITEIWLSQKNQKV